MNRRDFLSMATATGAALSMPRAFGSVMLQADALPTARSRCGKLLVLIELKGGNDGLNTVIPFADPRYYSLRRTLAVPRERVIALDERAGLHPSLAPLLPLWRDGELAVVQGVGYAQMNTSHYRSMQIWDTGSSADVYRRDGWLSRAFEQSPDSRPRFSIARWGSVEAGPFAGFESSGAADREHSVAWLPSFAGSIEAALRAALDGTTPDASGAIRLTLDGFDTHARQAERHGALLSQLAQGCVTLRDQLTRRGRWRDTLVVTYSEFGRALRENENGGTDHGGAAAHFVMGGRVRGGLYGPAPALALTSLDANDGLAPGIDFRQLYATALGPFFGLDARAILNDVVRPLPLLRV